MLPWHLSIHLEDKCIHLKIIEGESENERESVSEREREKIKIARKSIKKLKKISTQHKLLLLYLEKSVRVYD